MQTIVGSNGQIGQELAKELYQNYTKDIRLVSRNPQKVNASDQVYPANLLNFEEAKQAISGSDIVYFTVGLPMDSSLWETQFPVIVDNVIRACKFHQSKLVFFDNTYMYAKTNQPQLEDSPFVPEGKKSHVRANIAKMVVDEINSGELEAVICRAPEFYGPGKTQSITNTMVFNAIKADKTVKLPLSDKTLRTLIWTPDASRAMALIGNTPDCYGQTWHLPCAESISYQELIALIQNVTGKKVKYMVVHMWQFKLGSLFSKGLRELKELLPRYQIDTIFISDKFKERFPAFQTTSFEDGVKEIVK